MQDPKTQVNPQTPPEFSTECQGYGFCATTAAGASVVTQRNLGIKWHSFYLAGVPRALRGWGTP